MLGRQPGGTLMLRPNKALQSETPIGIRWIVKMTSSVHGTGEQLTQLKLKTCSLNLSLVC